MAVMVRRVVVLAVALGLTWMVFFGAGYFGTVWTHYFSSESEPKNTGEVSVNVINPQPVRTPVQCTKDHPCPAPPHE